MVACLSCTPDPFPLKNAFSSYKVKFASPEALVLLQRCADFKRLKQIHAKIIRNGLCHDQLLLGKLLCLCSSYGKVDYAAMVFHHSERRVTFIWNLMIRCLSVNGRSSQALDLFNRMISQGVSLDKFTFPFVIKACTTASAIHKGKEVHGLAMKTGYSKDMFLQNTLMDLGFKCGDPKYGCKVFEKMRVRNVVSWTTMITGLVSCGEVVVARSIFEQMPVRNVVSWTAMINGYVRNQQPHEAFEFFRRMQLDNVRPNGFTLVSLLKACADIGSLKLGRWVHDFALKNGFEFGDFLGTALIDMYSKCGSLEDAKKVFDNMQTKSLATWNSMITSLGVHGCGEEALALFVQMEKGNIQPDGITFIGVLCACVHTGNVDEGCWYFKSMIECHGIAPVVEHYTCMIQLLNRGNVLDEVRKPVKITVQR